MELRRLGRTELKTSVLGYGCGAVGGLMVRGSAADQERAIARAVELGINYFDTAALYGDGESERNLGRVLATLRPDVIVGTKVRLPTPVERGRIGDAVARSLEDSLRRLGRDHVDLFQLHNPITTDGHGTTIGVAAVLDEAVAAFERLRQQGKTRFIGITALGDTAALHTVADARAFDTAQLVYNMLNPTAGNAAPEGMPGQDYGRLLDRTQRADMGVIGIRALAGGALSGSEARHPIGMAAVDPIGSGPSYAADARRARQFEALVREGHAGSIIEAALRFVIANPAMTTMLVGTSTLDELEAAGQAVSKGPLPQAALARAAAIAAG
ncbi:aldo/keto reductase [Vineibacter terrae]|uniref:Aldo/keto reductase n=1 Tax=Vineibacter terrae TaxID=2586908 RepID=A0A5C8PQG4_9HYPH|nr:aldo/keto reductase [Vineibacter terrae]TXL77172.1 aldo/keto reductase [Vineibacter terrae]